MILDDTEGVRLSLKEHGRWQALKCYLGGRMTAKQVADAIRLSVRQVRRLIKRARVRGIHGVVHGNRGRQSNRGIKAKVAGRICNFYRGDYRGFNLTHFRETLVRKEKMSPPCRETIRQILVKEDLWERRRKAPKHRQRRPRREREGEMLQIDASFHPWFGEDGPVVALVGAIDDATGKVVAALFVEAETTEAYMALLRIVLAKYGIPLSTYSDHDSVFFVNNPKERELAMDTGRRLETQFGRAMRELGVRLIPASSPQAKGRVERLWETYQDRLLHELRLEGIKTKDGGNRYLSSQFLPRHNRQFSVAAMKSETAWRPNPGPARLASVLCHKETRVLANDHTFSFEREAWQVRPTQGIPALAKRRIEIRKTLQGHVQAWFGEKRLKLAPAPTTLRLVHPATPPTPLTAMANAAAAYTRRAKLRF